MLDNLIKDVSESVFRIPPEYCTDIDTARIYLAGKVAERNEIIRKIKDNLGVKND